MAATCGENSGSGGRWGRLPLAHHQEPHQVGDGGLCVCSYSVDVVKEAKLGSLLIACVVAEKGLVKATQGLLACKMHICQHLHPFVHATSLGRAPHVPFPIPWQARWHQRDRSRPHLDAITLPGHCYYAGMEP